MLFNRTSNRLHLKLSFVWLVPLFFLALAANASSPGKSCCEELKVCGVFADETFRLDIGTRKFGSNAWWYLGLFELEDRAWWVKGTTRLFKIDCVRDSNLRIRYFIGGKLVGGREYDKTEFHLTEKGVKLDVLRKYGRVYDMFPNYGFQKRDASLFLDYEGLGCEYSNLIFAFTLIILSYDRSNGVQKYPFAK